MGDSVTLFGWHGANYVAFLLLFWANLIGPEEHCQQNFSKMSAAMRELCPTGADELRAQEKLPAEPEPTGAAIVKAPLQVAEAPPFDRQAFMTSFSRQANLGLKACLIQEGAPRGSVLLEARLTREGKLRHIKPLHRGSDWPACAPFKIQQMNFRALTRRMASEDQAVQWRLDW